MKYSKVCLSIYEWTRKSAFFKTHGIFMNDYYLDPSITQCHEFYISDDGGSGFYLDSGKICGMFQSGPDETAGILDVITHAIDKGGISVTIPECELANEVMNLGFVEVDSERLLTLRTEAYLP